VIARRIGFISSFAISVIILSIVPSVAETPVTISLGYCSSAESTNCIESLNLIEADNSIKIGSYISGTAAEFEFAKTTFSTGDGRVQVGMSWRPDGAPLCWWGQCDYHSGSIDMGIYPTSSLARLNAGTIPFPGEDPRQCGEKTNPTLCGKWFNFGGSYRFVFRFRALGFHIGMVSGRAKDVGFKDLNPNSGNEVSHTYEVSATNINSDSYIINDIRNTQPRDRAHADFYSDGLIMWFWDVNNSATSRLPSQCSAAKISGPPTQLLFNTFNMGSPMWNASDSTLSVQLESSHLAYDGTPNKGFYEMVFSKATSECLWGLNPEKSVRAEVKISYADGGQADVATVSQVFDAGQLRITASNFHLSQPTISTRLIQLTTEEPDKTTVDMSSPKLENKSSNKTTSKKKIEVNCYKGQTIKKISGTNPKCPSGYKKK
jgi:hypothetical protein